MEVLLETDSNFDPCLKYTSCVSDNNTFLDGGLSSGRVLSWLVARDKKKDREDAKRGERGEGGGADARR